MQGPGGQWRWYGAYVRAHAAQRMALRALGGPPSGNDIYRRWLDAFGQRLALERRQLALLRRWDLPNAATIQARIANLEARGNADGLAFGLRTCVSNGPAGAPKG